MGSSNFLTGPNHNRTVGEYPIMADNTDTTILTRRAVFGAIAAVPALAVLPAIAQADDAELLALGAKILHRCDVANEFQATRVDPFEDEFQRRLRANKFDRK